MGRGQRVPRSGPKDQDISKSHSNMSLTLKKGHLVNLIYKEKVQLQILLDLMKIGGKYLIEIIYKSSIFMKREQEPIAKQ